MKTKELIETLKLQATFVNAGGYINQGNVMKEAAEKLEELEKDVKRYQWLCDGACFNQDGDVHTLTFESFTCRPPSTIWDEGFDGEIDNCIDDAISKQTEAKP